MGHFHHHGDGHGHTHTASPATFGQGGDHAHGPQLRRVALAAIAVAITLMTAKIWAWGATDATSLLSSLADSLFDVLVSWINFFAIRYAIKPADEDHRFGHRSIEDIAGLAQFAFICGSMVFVIAQAMLGLTHGHQVKSPEDGIAVMLISLVLTSALVLYQRRVIQTTGSLIVKADSLHYFSDIMMNLSVIASLLAVRYLGWMWTDAVLAILIALYVMREGMHIGQRSFNNLMNKEMPDEEKERIHALLAQYPQVLGMHNLKTRYSGSKPFIQMHVDLIDTLSFVEAHAIVDRIEEDLCTLFTQADVIVHPDPVSAQRQNHGQT